MSEVDRIALAGDIRRRVVRLGRPHLRQAFSQRRSGRYGHHTKQRRAFPQLLDYRARHGGLVAAENASRSNLTARPIVLFADFHGSLVIPIEPGRPNQRGFDSRFRRLRTAGVGRKGKS